MVNDDMYDDLNKSSGDSRLKYSSERSLMTSEYEDIIRWCNIFKECFRKGWIDERNRVFNILVKVAKHRKELPSLMDYYTKECPECGGEGCEECYRGLQIERIGKYKNTSETMKSLEYVIALEQRVKDLQDDKIKPKRIK